ncbi:four helix bundle protein [uncultured Alcanivorax sp.]|uniref:four helix bundle protein n=1 Tax=uncultured Alcanivorax sp. TaxID=191215 RepID=UPI00262E4CC4|nr:four helix bundle protein [uncultured Alcanivorax sp.]
MPGSGGIGRRIYGMTEGWPREERFGLAGQMERTALGIPSNITVIEKVFALMSGMLEAA